MVSSIFTIPQKMSNSGTIHDISSDQYSRGIVFRKDCIYAVVLASYYGGKGYTTHKTAAAAIAESSVQREYSHRIIDRDGNEYIMADETTLHRTGVSYKD